MSDTEAMLTKGSKQQEAEADSSFDLADLAYELPSDLIAQHPPPTRDGGRLLAVDRSDDSLVDAQVKDLPDFLRRGDLIVVNDTKVVPAQFSGHRPTGGKVRGLFLRELDRGRWSVLLESSGRLRRDETISLVSPSGEHAAITLVESTGPGRWSVDVEPDEPAADLLNRIGTTPLPPYIRRDVAAASQDEDRTRYQTVYARRSGAVAAPTAGLHLTETLLDRLRASGVDIAAITLHIGLGTFQPIRSQRLAEHDMHEEWFEVDRETASRIRRCRAGGGRVIAVGTTVVRALESAAQRSGGRHVGPCAGMTDVFIYPPFDFRVVDGLMTNFHLPSSTLLALVMAFAGVDRIRRAYRHATQLRYRFYSYGDAMLIT